MPLDEQAILAILQQNQAAQSSVFTLANFGIGLVMALFALGLGAIANLISGVLKSLAGLWTIAKWVQDNHVDPAVVDGAAEMTGKVLDAQLITNQLMEGDQKWKDHVDRTLALFLDRLEVSDIERLRLATGDQPRGG